MPDKTCPFCGRRFDASVQFCQDDGTPLTLAAGTVLAGRYEIVRELGRGAMGVVYRAKERDLGDRPCAIKILRVPPGTSREAMADAVARLKREASMLGSLGSHPNLVTVYTAGQDDSGLWYIVMEYVEGETLGVKFGLGTPFTSDQAARIVRQIAQGLQRAHDQGVLHRDLKPGNLILTPTPESSGWVKIVDFGIAKPTEHGASDLTRTSHVVGTPRYMSPEQRSGHPLGPASDVYSLALIAAELLSDERAVPAGGVGGGGPHADLPADLDSWPASLQAVLARGLARDASDRFASALEFAEAFEAAVDGWHPVEEWDVEKGWDPVDDAPPGMPVGEAKTDPGRSPEIGVGRGSGRRMPRGWVAVGIVGMLGGAVWAATALGPGPAAVDPPPLLEGVAPAESAATTTSSSTAGDSFSDDGPSVQEDLTPDESGAEGRLASGDETAEGPDRSPPGNRPTDATGAPAEAAENPPAGPRDPVGHGAAVAALRSRVDPAESDTVGLGQVVVDATRLLETPGVPDTLAVEVRYLRAEGRLMLGDEAGACADLEAIRASGESDAWVRARYGRAVAALLDLNCRQPG